MRILVTGGTGYIGCHTCLVLLARGHHVAVADNFSNSSPEVVERLQRLSGVSIGLHRVDIRDEFSMLKLLKSGHFDAVVHFAALKSVGESCREPLEYFDNNIAGSIALLRAMKAAKIRRLVFSSSATVYGDPAQVPVREDAGLQVTSPYGRTKLVVEQMIGDMCESDPRFHTANLRYFNPVGAHASGMIGEEPAGIPNNLMPYICQVAVGRREALRVFGNDYPTIDGTGVRDYIHVVDLARAHADALDYLEKSERSLTVNLGTGRGVSVLQLVRAFEQASGQSIPLEFTARRAGDVAEVYADPSLANELLGWRSELGLDAMCRDAWRWQQLNPNGYRDRGAEETVPEPWRIAAPPAAGARVQP
ncbi:MAG: UDP-glucose 4-epimerase GalE [Pseudomonadota bacterium]|nr:UDP-glucose 4-epimerase GalE [Pseudomonadota bacterium]